MSIAKDCCLICILILTFYYIFQYNSLKRKFFKEKELFIHILGHDFRVPVIAQIRGLDLVLQKSFVVQEDDFLLDEINKSCKYTLDMVTMLMNIYKIENGEIILNYENINLRECFTTILDEFSDCIESKNINIVFDVGNESIYADKTYFIKALRILINTVLRYSANNKTVSITLLKNINGMKLTLKYVGNSLSQDEYSRLFELNPTYSAVGQGIQMYLCKKIIDLHNGKIKFCPKLNQNNDFDVILPY